jgi:hypothetical protein
MYWKWKQKKKQTSRPALSEKSGGVGLKFRSTFSFENQTQTFLKKWLSVILIHFNNQNIAQPFMDESVQKMIFFNQNIYWFNT